MSAENHFLDTNIFVYTFDLKAKAKAKRAEDLIHAALASGRGMISYQVTQEFVSVARNRFPQPLTWPQARAYLETPLRPLMTIHSSPALFDRALTLSYADQISWFDALIVAAAIQGECKILYTEDMQHGRRFGDLVVQNPFL
jgi:predicted nucleic acid-binding protein